MRAVVGILVCWSTLFALPLEVRAGPHLGIKMAAQRYGEAWRSRDRGQLHGAITGDFARAWARIPEEQFKSLPRFSGRQLLSTRKGAGVASVSIVTEGGPATLVLVGGGFNWSVDDILRPAPDGRWTSVKETLHAGSSAREFTHDFSSRTTVGDFERVVSNRFLNAWCQLPNNTRARIRHHFPVGKAGPLPEVSIDSTKATVIVRPDGTFRGPEAADQVSFSMVKEGEWKVDDVAFAAGWLRTDSFRAHLDELGAIANLQAFARDRTAIAPEVFAAPGELLQELQALGNNGGRPAGMELGKMTRLELSADGSAARMAFEKGELAITFTRGPNGLSLIQRVGIRAAGSSSPIDLAAALAATRTLRRLPGASGVAQWFGFVTDHAD